MFPYYHLHSILLSCGCAIKSTMLHERTLRLSPISVWFGPKLFLYQTFQDVASGATVYADIFIDSFGV